MSGIQMHYFEVVGEDQIRQCENTFKLKYVVCRHKFWRWHIIIGVCTPFKDSTENIILIKKI